MKIRANIGLITLGILAVAVLAVLAVALLPAPAPTARPTGDDRSRKSKLIKSAKKPRPEKKKQVQPVATKRPEVSAPDDGLSPEDRKLIADIQDALDLEDLEKIREFLKKARGSATSEVRKAIAEALGWFGVKAMADLAPFIDDSDEDVRQAASSSWDTILNDLDDDEVKTAIIVETLQTVRDADVAELVAFKLTGVDEKLAVNAIVKLLSGALTVSKVGRDKIRETYEVITGNEYTGAYDARQWLKENNESSEEGAR